MTIYRVRIRWLRVAALLAVIAAIAAALSTHLPGPSTASSAPTTTLDEPVVVAPQGDPEFANLDPDLLDALHRASADASADGVGLVVDSGWRSPEHQQRLLDEAVAKYGSAEEAARWVATPETSAHVSGDAVDVGPQRAAAWLGEHGSAYGLCRIYANEPWHFELRPDAPANGCPPPYPDPTHDPRLHP